MCNTKLREKYKMYSKNSDKEKSLLNKEISGIMFHGVGIICQNFERVTEFHLISMDNGSIRGKCEQN